MTGKKDVAAASLCLATALAGCSTNGTAPAEQTGPGVAMMCEAAPAQAHLGKRADAVIGAVILAASGARTLRWGPPRSAWTMDYRQDRVNVQYDDAMIIDKITCG